MDVKGAFNVQKSNVLGSTIQYRIMLLSDRLLFVKTGGLFAAEGGAVTIAALAGVLILSQVGLLLYGIMGLGVFGAVGGGVSALLVALSQKSRRGRIARLTNPLYYSSPDELLQLDNSNLSILYTEIAAAKIHKADYGFKKGRLIISAGREYRYDIIDDQPVTYLNELLSAIRHE